MTASEYKLYGGEDLKLAVVRLDDVGTGGIDNMATTLPVGTGQGINYAGASVSAFQYIKVEDEIVKVTGRTADNLTVVRAQLGTSAAAHAAGVGKVKAFSEFDMPFVNAFTLDPNVDNITFEGDGTTEQVPVSGGVTGSFTLGKFTTALLENIAGVEKVTSGLPADEVSSYAPELGDYPYVRARLRLKAQDEETGSYTGIRLEVPKMKIQNPWVPGDAGNNAAMNSETAWSSSGAAVDLIGVPLPGVASDESIHYRVATLA